MSQRCQKPPSRAWLEITRGPQLRQPHQYDNSLSSTDARFSPYEPNVEANQKEHEVDDAPQSQQFWRNENGKPKKRNGQVSLSNIEIRVYPRANKKRTGEKFTDLFPINTHNPTFPK